MSLCGEMTSCHSKTREIRKIDKNSANPHVSLSGLAEILNGYEK